MFTKYILIPAVMSLAGLLMSPMDALAQHRGSHSGGHVSRGGGGHVAHGGTHFRGGYYGGGYYGGGYYGYNRGWWPGYYSSYYWPSYSPYWYDNYTYAYPSGSYTYSAPTTSYYYAPPTPSQSYVGAAPVAASAATIRVILPDPQAQVWFNDNATTQTGPSRLFNTPPLTSSGTYAIRASWMQGGQEMAADRTVTVSPGQSLVVDFTRP